MSAIDAVLAVNAGSSSLKFGLYDGDAPARWSGSFEGLEPGGRPRWRHGGSGGRSGPLPLEVAAGEDPFDLALRTLFNELESHPVQLAAVSHRIVHGGSRFVAPCRLDDDVLTELSALEPLAPLHQPHNLAGVRAFRKAQPRLPQVGCFDTAFHTTMMQEEKDLPLPAELTSAGLRRYGFHGLSYEFVVGALGRAGASIRGAALLAHLGNGASLCATRQGRSVASTMGFSALDGLMMGTRCGSLDPGVVLHLWRQGWTLDKVERLLYRESGLKGVSGLSADMKLLRSSDDPAAKRAISLFTHRVRREAGALLNVLGGLDLIAFTGGIGEHDAVLRKDLAASLAYTGLQIDSAANLAATGDELMPIHTADSDVEVWVVPTDEGRVAAASAFALLERTT